ncbi:hypothetical protein GW17_00013117 [Ensete ventricosum]|nr:hypothetical protein GW17_00013117 [Ensete ventricosum]
MDLLATAVAPGNVCASQQQRAAATATLATARAEHWAGRAGSNRALPAMRKRWSHSRQPRPSKGRAGDAARAATVRRQRPHRRRRRRR